MPEKRTVHALQGGQPLCGFSQDIPANWPSSHAWTEVDDLENINCCACKSKAEELAKDKT
jgi:hypothetical protein